MGYNADHCWFADNVTAIMLVVKKKKKNKNIYKSAALSIHPISGFNYCWQLAVANETAISKISKKGSFFGNLSAYGIS